MNFYEFIIFFVKLKDCLWKFCVFDDEDDDDEGNDEVEQYVNEYESLE